MVLEATVICLDNSDWMRNGDYTPTRLEAQHDAINLICGAKTHSNPENTVGAISCGGKSPEVLVTLTGDLGKILSSLHGIKVGGSLDFLAGVQVAQLVLKHRQNKNQQQRIIFFVGSPITTSKEELVKVAKRLKKNNVAIDIVNFGEETENTEKLEAFLNAVNSNDNSHLVTIPPGPHILSDILISSPIISGGEDMGGGGGGIPSAASGDFGFGGIDPNLDPELALALKVSMEEERARQEAQVKGTEGASTPAESQKPAETQQPAGKAHEVEMGEAHEDEEMLLEQALAMSMQGNAPPTTNTPTTPAVAPKPVTTPQTKPDEEDQEMQMALQMSMMQQQQQQQQQQQEKRPQPPATTQTPEDINRIMEDPNFVNSVLMSLPGVDPNDERIKNSLANLSKEPEKKDKDSKDPEKK